MPATLPVDTAPQECIAKPFSVALYADEAKKRPVTLPPGATLRACPAPIDGAQVLTKPDSGGTEMCIFYELGVDPKNPSLKTRRQKAGVTKSLPDKSCPPIDYSRTGYPGKLWFFLSENVILPNAFKIKAKVEAEGLAFLKAETARAPGTRPVADYGNTPLLMYGIAEARAIECRKNASTFQGRYAACYRADVYNSAVRGDRSLIVALTKNGAYHFIESIRNVTEAAEAAGAR